MDSFESNSVMPRRPKRPLRIFHAVASFLFVLAVLSTPSAAQTGNDDELRNLAARASIPLQKVIGERSSAARILLFRFFDKDEKFSSFGDETTKNFADLLRAQAQGYSVIDSFSSPDAAQFDGLGPMLFESSKWGDCLQIDPSMRAIVAGKIIGRSGRISLSLRVVGADQTHKRVFESNVPLTLLPATSLSPYSLTAKRGYLVWTSQEHAPDPGDPPLFSPEVKNQSYEPPQCLYCPHPDYPEAALKARAHGKVLMRVQIDPGGYPTRIWMVRPLPECDLDAAAVESLKKWTFKPGRSPSHSPIMMEIMIESSFHVD